MLFFCRHGETMHNRKKIKQGRFPSLLTLKGIDQAKSMAYKILDHEKNFENYKLISSPMVRTRHTMQIIQEVLGISDKQVILEELINERDAGDFTNIPKELINKNFPEFVEKKGKASCYAYKPLKAGIIATMFIMFHRKISIYII